MTQAKPGGTITAIIIPDNATVMEAAQLAVASHLHLITDGQRVILSPAVMPGWHRLAVRVKPTPPLNPMEQTLCAA